MLFETFEWMSLWQVGRKQAVFKKTIQSLTILFDEEENIVNYTHRTEIEDTNIANISPFDPVEANYCQSDQLYLKKKNLESKDSDNNLTKQGPEIDDKRILGTSTSSRSLQIANLLHLLRVFFDMILPIAYQKQMF